MKPFLFALFFTITLFSQTLSWRGDYDKAHQEALQRHKPLLVLVVKAEDKRTYEVLRTLFMDQPYIEALNEKVIAVMVTYEGRAGYPVEMYYATKFPALFLVDERELFMAKPLYGDEITARKIKALLDLL